MIKLTVSSGSFVYDEYDTSVLCTSANASYSYMEQYGKPKLISVSDYGETVEVTYIETATAYISYGYNDTPPRRVFKIVYSCVDGKFHKS